MGVKTRLSPRPAGTLAEALVGATPYSVVTVARCTESIAINDRRATRENRDPVV
jgi:hypothetical protein